MQCRPAVAGRSEDRAMKRLAWMAVFLLSAGFYAADAQAQTGAARGKVFDEAKQPVEGAKVAIDAQGGMTRHFETKTNKKGEFTQVGLPPGIYRFTATKDGFQGTYIEIKIGIGDPTPVPELVLKKAGGGAGAAGGGETEMREGFKKALELTQAGKLDEAEAAYKELLAKAPMIPEAHYNLGYIYSQKKDWAAAEAAYQKALELRPDYGDATVALARVYQDSGQAEKAEAIWKQAGSSTDPKILFNLGITHFNSGQAAEANAAFKKVLEADSSNLDALYFVGNTYFQLGQYADAVTALEKYVATAPPTAQNMPVAKGLLDAAKKATGK